MWDMGYPSVRRQRPFDALRTTGEVSRQAVTLASSRAASTGQFEYCVRLVRAIRGDLVARADSPTCTATGALRIARSSFGWLAALGRRKRGPRPSTLEPCLLERSAGGWPADRPSDNKRYPLP